MSRNAVCGAWGFLDVDGPTAWPYTPSEAFTRWVLPEVDVLYRVARSLTGQAADAEDLVQDTLVRAYRAIGTFDGRHPRAWLLTILRNTARNRSRKAPPRLLDDHDYVEPEAAPDDRPEYVVVDRRFDAVVAQASDELPERFREVIVFVDIEGFCYAEAAEALGVPLGTLMSRLHRARMRIRRQLEQAGVGIARGVR
jgi:RNA polymerase sigma-70 factor (ECF subfamily)